MMKPMLQRKERPNGWKVPFKSVDAKATLIQNRIKLTKRGVFGSVA